MKTVINEIRIGRDDERSIYKVPNQGGLLIAPYFIFIDKWRPFFIPSNIINDRDKVHAMIKQSFEYLFSMNPFDLIICDAFEDEDEFEDTDKEEQEEEEYLSLLSLSSYKEIIEDIIMYYYEAYDRFAEEIE